MKFALKHGKAPTVPEACSNAVLMKAIPSIQIDRSSMHIGPASLSCQKPCTVFHALLTPGFRPSYTRMRKPQTSAHDAKFAI